MVIEGLKGQNNDNKRVLWTSGKERKRKAEGIELGAKTRKRIRWPRRVHISPSFI